MFFETRDRIAAALQELTGEDDVLLADGGEHADLSSTVAFPLAKKRRQAPAQLAQGLAAELAPRLAGAGVTVEATGPYLNFRFGTAYLEGAVRAALAPGYGALPAKHERVVLEHTSANPNGPLHVGHIRNSVIGDTLARAFRKAGYSTEVQYYVNDMGRQIAIVVWGMDRLGIEAEPGEKPDHYTARVYVEANRRIEADPAITAEVDALMQQVEAQDPATVKKFRTVVARCLDGFKETLADLATPHDRYRLGVGLPPDRGHGAAPPPVRPADRGAPGRGLLARPLRVRDHRTGTCSGARTGRACTRPATSRTTSGRRGTRTASSTCSARTTS